MPNYDYSTPLDTNVTGLSERFDHATIYLSDEIKEICGISRWHQRHQDHLKLILINLYKNFCVHPQLYTCYSRNRNRYNLINRYNSILIKYDATVKIIDSLEQLKYVEGVKGFHFKEQRKFRDARFKATDKLIRLLEERFEFSSICIKRSDNEEVIILKDTLKNLVDYKDTTNTVEMRCNLHNINSLYQNHFFALRLPDKQLYKLNERLMSNHKFNEDKHPNLIDYSKNKLKRIFNNSSFEEGGRFYNCWWQGVPGEYRPYITIDDEATIEIDFSGYHIRMLYIIEGLPIPEEDVYTVCGLPYSARVALKRIMNILLNAGSMRKAVGGIKRMIVNEGYTEFFERVTIDSVISALKEKHKPIKKYFLTGHGIKLQYIDSKITEGILLVLAKEDVAALPIHDSFIVQLKHKDRLASVMEEEVVKQIGQTIGHKFDKTAFETDILVLKDNILPEDLPQSQEEYEEEWVQECVGYRKRYDEWLQLMNNMELE